MYIIDGAYDAAKIKVNNGNVFIEFVKYSLHEKLYSLEFILDTISHTNGYSTNEQDQILKLATGSFKATKKKLRDSRILGDLCLLDS